MVEARPAQALTPPASPVRRAIILDDDPAVLAILAETLVGAGLAVCAVGSADAAFVAMGGLPAPSILITDIDLGAGPNGIAVAERARAQWPAMPIFIVSGGQIGDVSLESRLQARFFPKPIRMVAFLAALTDAVSGMTFPAQTVRPHRSDMS